MISKRLLLLAALSTVPFAACNCDEEPLTRSEAPDASEPPIVFDSGDGAPDAYVPDVEGPESRVLTFDGTSPVTLYFGAAADLRFTLRTESGVAVPQETIRFAVMGTAGVLGAASAVSDANGVAT